MFKLFNSKKKSSFFCFSLYNKLKMFDFNGFSFKQNSFMSKNNVISFMYLNKPTILQFDNVIFFECLILLFLIIFFIEFESSIIISICKILLSSLSSITFLFFIIRFLQLQSKTLQLKSLILTFKIISLLSFLIKLISFL